MPTIICPINVYSFQQKSQSVSAIFFLLFQDLTYLELKSCVNYNKLGINLIQSINQLLIGICPVVWASEDSEFSVAS